MPLAMFMKNQGGLNLTDSPLTIQDNQATGQSWNYDYAITGVLSKTLHSLQINSVADAQLNTLGLGVLHDAVTDVRTVVRAAGTKLQTVNTSSGVCANQTDDTASAATDFFNSNATEPVVFTEFNVNTGASTAIWMAGASLAKIYGFTGTNVTANGIAAPTGSFTATRAANGGSWASTGTYYYGVAYRKKSTQALSNVALDVSATISATTDTVNINLSGLTGLDTTLVDKIYLYRSAVGGVSGFTTGDLVAEITSTATTYADTGDSADIAVSINIQRSGNIILDNSQLPSGSFNCLTAFKRRLVTASGSTLYIGDLDKPESWPLENRIVIPSGGDITALGTIGVPSEYTTGADQYLCIWKENELWALTGTSPDDWELLFIDQTGCSVQSLVVSINSYVTWITYNGVFLWNGRGKPTRVSMPIQALFMDDGDISTSGLTTGYGVHYKKANQVIWRLSHRTKGTNKIFLKLDTRLTNTFMFFQSNALQNPDLNGVFIMDYDAISYYGMVSFLSSTGEEILYMCDNAGNFYKAFADASTAIDFEYETRPLDMGSPEKNKRFKRVIVWVERLTNNDLTLLFWADNRIRSEDESTMQVSMSPLNGNVPSIWDVAVWDSNQWDDYYPDIAPIQFNLNPNENNCEGYALKLRFSQTEADAPVRIHGFAVEFDDIGDMSIPISQVESA